MLLKSEKQKQKTIKIKGMFEISQLTFDEISNIRDEKQKGIIKTFLFGNPGIELEIMPAHWYREMTRFIYKNNGEHNILYCVGNWKVSNFFVDREENLKFGDEIEVKKIIFETYDSPNCGYITSTKEVGYNSAGLINFRYYNEIYFDVQGKRYENYLDLPDTKNYTEKYVSKITARFRHELYKQIIGMEIEII